jgi:hypothetical protein
MLAKLFVSRLSACLFLLSFSSSQLITSDPSQLGNYFIKPVKSLSPLRRGLAVRTSVVIRSEGRSTRPARQSLGGCALIRAM